MSSENKRKHLFDVQYTYLTLNGIYFDKASSHNKQILHSLFHKSCKASAPPFSFTSSTLLSNQATTKTTLLISYPHLDQSKGEMRISIESSRHFIFNAGRLARRIVRAALLELCDEFRVYCS